jgi:predicted nucleic acid-binding protein
LITLPVLARSGHPILQRVISGEPVAVSSLVWHEFQVGPLSSGESELAAEVFNDVGRRRVFKTDAMIAAVAIRAQAELMTLNKRDFEPFSSLGLKLAVC